MSSSRLTGLNRTVGYLERDGPSAFIPQLNIELAAVKARAGKELFSKEIIPLALQHPVRAVIHQGPVEYHSFTQPRGYPGDASLLDLIYRHPCADSVYASATPLGRGISEFSTTTSVCAAVRERREILAKRIDEIAATRPGAEIFSLACGHLREAEISEAVKANELKRFLAGDQDELSLKVVADNAGVLSKAVEARKVRVRDVVTGASTDLGKFDFIYAAGLYDYLDARLSAALTARLFAHLKPEGVLLIGNYLTGLWEVPYMETFMAWSLIYRDPDQIKAFSASIDPTQIAASRYFGDQSGCVGYLELVRA